MAGKPPPDVSALMPLPALAGAAPEYAVNQTPSFPDLNLFVSNPALGAAAAGLPVQDRVDLDMLGAQWGSAEFFELGRLANEHVPRLQTHDARGARIDFVEFHPAWHRLMQAGMAGGLHNLKWTGGSHLARCIRLYMAYQAEAGHVCPLTMTHAALAALQACPDIAGPWRERICSSAYDPSFRPWWEKSAVTLGMGMTERQGGTDVRANMSEAVAAGDHYLISGHKWFMSAPMCDGFLVLAQARAGLTCFLLPRFCPDGSLNGLHFQRLKNKLGNRSNASGEVEFHDAYGERIGEEGRGIRTIINMVQLTRMDCIAASAGLMRLGLASAVHHARHRSVFQRLLIDQPLMRATLADMALEVEAATALALRLAQSFDRSPQDPLEAVYARLMTPAIKYHVCKSAPALLYEAMECHGGSGYVEDLPLARAYREAPVNAIWEGSGNVVALDILRAAQSQPDETASLIAGLADRCSGDVRGTLQATAQETLALLRGGEAQTHARLIAERLAKMAAIAALDQLHSDLAALYCDRRIRGPVASTFGAHAGGRQAGPASQSTESKLLERAHACALVPA